MGKVNVICGTWGRVKVKKTYWNCEPFTKRAVLHAALLIGLVNEPLLWEYNIWIEIWNLFIFCFSHLTIRFPAKLLLRVFCENNGMLFLKFWRSAGQNQKKLKLQIYIARLSMSIGLASVLYISCLCVIVRQFLIWRMTFRRLLFSSNLIRLRADVRNLKLEVLRPIVLLYFATTFRPSTYWDIS